ncbi:MAG: hypothetical protein ABSD78_11115 [Acidimicrobiales bacterium]|jgi:hypothetical protein
MTVTEAPAVEGTDNPVSPAESGEPARPERVSRAAAAVPTLALIAIPIVIFAGGALLAGHPLLSGDNLIQSYPLRVLVGTDLLHGRLPAWDPWIWGGTPLMAGLNAGAFYPTTLLFAVMSPAAAWIIGQIVMSSLIAVGTYLFFRLSGIGRPACFLGAASFAFAGAVASQGAVHLDMGEGLTALPWLLIAIRKIIDDRRWRWSILLAAATALLLLAGSPEAMLDVGAMCAAYTLLRLSLQPPAWERLLTRGGAGTALGLGLSAFVWVPALHFISISQRADLGSSFSATYSYPPRALILGVLPYVEGGLGVFGQPQYFGLSNLPEVAFYVGVLPIVAALALCAPRWKQWLPRGERRTWYGIVVVGLVLAVAAGTPLVHVISHIPFYGRQRDQGRNIVQVDFAACALLAWWIDGGTRPAGARTRSEIAAVYAIVGVVAVIGLWLTVSPSSLWHTLGAFAPTEAQLGGIGAGMALTGGLAVLAGGIVLARHRMSRSRWLALVTLFVAVDLAVFTDTTSLTASQVTPSASRPGPLVQMIKANLEPGARYAVFDPDLFYPSAILKAGEPDLGILTSLASVQGYGAILDAKYSHDTGTHGRAFLGQRDLSAGVFRQLDLEVLLAPAEEFLLPISTMPSPGARASLTPVSEAAGADPILPAGSQPIAQDLLPPVVPAPPRAPLSAGKFEGWFFGTDLSPAAASLVLSTPSAGQVIRVGLVMGAPALATQRPAPGGPVPRPAESIDWQPAQRLGTGGTTVPLSYPDTPSLGLAIQLVSGPKLGRAQLAIKAEGHAFAVDGPLSAALTPVSWFGVGRADHFTVFRAGYTPAPAWVERVGSHSVNSISEVEASTQIVANGYDSTTIEIRTPAPAELTRSAAWDSGWRAELVTGAAASTDLNGKPNGGPLPHATPVAVQQVGLVQGVEVPAGLSVVRFWYEPQGFSTGVDLGVVALALGLAGCVVAIVWERRRRRRLPDVAAADSAAAGAAAE